MTVGVDWSTFRFQPLGTGGSYTDDYRFSPATLDLNVWIYNVQDDSTTVTIEYTDVGPVTL